MRAPVGCVVLGMMACAVTAPRAALAAGESINGFPNWAERVMLEWTNRARSDPGFEMTACGANCGEAACYGPKPPLSWSETLNHAARFHAAEMTRQGYFDHNSHCTLVGNVSVLFPDYCDGSASCACVGATVACNPVCTSWSARVALFGPSATGEIIATPSDPNASFYLWLHEPSSSPLCEWSTANGHRWLLLDNDGSVGFGATARSVGDFSNGSIPSGIVSGAHYPRQSASVEVWANWFAGAAPASAAVNVDGTCVPMTRKRGTDTNGAWSATLTNVASGCHRYYFAFTDSSNKVLTWPDTGSLGIGPDGACADWDSTRPAMGAGCGCAPDCVGKQCGSDGCGGVCGTCAAGTKCEGTQCIACSPQCTGIVCGSDSCGGSCGTCTAPNVCIGGQCECVANCAGKECGSNGCGGTCGTCPTGETCVADKCTCASDCAGKVCGEDDWAGPAGRARPAPCVNPASARAFPSARARSAAPTVAAVSAARALRGRRASTVLADA